MDTLLTLAEVAVMLRVPPQTLRYWRMKGQGPASFKIGKKVMYTETSVYSWLKEQMEVTA